MNTAAGSSLRSTLLSFGAVLLAPVLIVAAVLLWQITTAEQARYEHEARAAALRIVAAIDRELAIIQASAQTLASSASLHAGNYARFHERAREIVGTWEKPENFAVVVRDTTGQQVVNTRLSWGTPLPRGAASEADREVIETRRALFQGIFIGATAGRPIVSVRVPVQSGDQVTHVLSIAIEPRHLAHVLAQQPLPNSWTSALIDRAGRIIARSVQHDGLVGVEAPAEFRARLGDREGVWTGANMEGTTVLAGYARSQLSGWTAVVSIPLSVLREPLWRSLLLIVALGAALLAISSVLAAWFGNRIAKPIRSLAGAAYALGKGEAVQPLSTGIREVDRVGEALASASLSLREADARQNLLMHELNHRVKNTLATVQSLAWQTLRRGLPSEVACERFESRLLSLSRTHNLLNESNWDGASIVDVLSLELEPYRGEGAVRFTLSGPDLTLPARTAVALGMVVHELTTNAVKHGALSAPEGRVTVTWEVRDRALSLEWREAGGPPVGEPGRQGFGSRLIKQTIGRELGGEVAFRFEREGLRCAMTIPLEKATRPADEDDRAGHSAPAEQIRSAPLEGVPNGALRNFRAGACVLSGRGPAAKPREST